MKRTIASLLVVVCAVLTTSFVIPADKKSHVQQSSKRLGDVEIDITSNSSFTGYFEVYFTSQTTGQVFLFTLGGNDWTHGGLPENDTYQVHLVAASANEYRMSACQFTVISNGPAVPNVGPGSGCYQFYITNN